MVEYSKIFFLALLENFLWGKPLDHLRKDGVSVVALGFEYQGRFDNQGRFEYKGRLFVNNLCTFSRASLFQFQLGL